MSEDLAVWRLSRNPFKPVWAKTVNNYPARKLELLTPQIRYICHQCGILKIMGNAIFFVKGSWLILVPVKALETVEAGQKSLFFKYMKTIFFFCRTYFFERFLYHSTIPVGLYRIFYLHLVYFIMKIYPVTREWDEADWLDPFVNKGRGIARRIIKLYPCFFFMKALMIYLSYRKSWYWQTLQALELFLHIWLPFVDERNLRLIKLKQVRASNPAFLYRPNGKEVEKKNRQNDSML